MYMNLKSYVTILTRCYLDGIIKFQSLVGDNKDDLMRLLSGCFSLMLPSTLAADTNLANTQGLATNLVLKSLRRLLSLFFKEYKCN